MIPATGIFPYRKKNIPNNSVVRCAPAYVYYIFLTLPETAADLGLTEEARGQCGLCFANTP